MADRPIFGPFSGKWGASVARCAPNPAPACDGRGLNFGLPAAIKRRGAPHRSCHSQL